MSAETQLEALRIELLGGFRIACGASEIPDDGWRLAKARSLVKIVVLAPGQSILREQLVELLWPDLDPDAGSNNLHQALHVARRTLGALLPDEKPNRILRLQRGILSLDPAAPLWIDVDVFEERARDLQTADDPGRFYETLDLYRGDLLPDDLYEDWAAERRIALHEQYLSLLDRLARLHVARREATPAIDALRRIVAIEPDRERAHRQLMELYALTGRRQQALRQYERVREILERELDLEPEPETDDLYGAILSGDFPFQTWTVEQPVTAEPESRPEITESIADFLGRAGDFVGRSQELGVLQEALERVIGGEGEIILVAGEPGIGKTRMSEEFLRYAGSQGVRTLWGRCYEGDGAPAYWPWVQIVRSYVEGRSTAELQKVMGPGAADIARITPELRDRLPDLEEPPPLDPDGERFRLFDSMTTFLKNAAERSPNGR
ncbi:MAG: BTAD domain-containing putative transcriptional regulator [Thermomicrobiales bacterium]